MFFSSIWFHNTLCKYWAPHRQRVGSYHCTTTIRCLSTEHQADLIPKQYLGSHAEIKYKQPHPWDGAAKQLLAFNFRVKGVT